MSAVLVLGHYGMSWKTFLQSHWEVVAASDMFTVEIWFGRSLVRYHILVAIELATRRVNIMGIVQEPYGKWMEQIARNATEGFSGFLLEKEYLIIGRDARFTEEFRSTLNVSGVNVIRTPPRPPNLNAHAERFVRSIKEECLGRVVVLGERHLRLLVRGYVERYHREQNHQGIGNQLLSGDAPSGSGCCDTTTQTRRRASKPLPQGGRVMPG